MADRDTAEQAPVVLQVDPDRVPVDLQECDQWVVWAWQHGARGWVKPPLSVGGGPASSTDPDTWGTWAGAVEALEADPELAGLGLMLEPGGELVGIDFDKCVTEGGVSDSKVSEAIEALDTYTEISPSGQGLRVFLRVESLEPFRGIKRTPPGGQCVCEVYSHSRYLTVTGHPVEGSPGVRTLSQEQWQEWYQGFWGEAPRAEGPTVERVEEEQRARYKVRNWPRLDPYKLQQLLASCPRAELAWSNHEAWDSCSEADMSLANWAHIRKWGTQEIIDLLCVHRRKWRDSGRDCQDKGLDYYLRTIEGSREQLFEGGQEGEDERGRIWLMEEVVLWPDPVYTVAGLLEQGTLTVLAGASGSCKSFLAMDWCCHIALGLPWHGRDTVQGQTLYIVGEGRSGIKDRCLAWMEHHQYTPEQCRDFGIIAAPTQLSAEDQVHYLAERIAARWPRCSLVVIDTLSRSMVGMDENTSQDMSQAIASADYIRSVTGAGVMLVHHHAKQRAQARGSSALIGAVHTIIDVNVTPGGIVQVSNSKQKDLEAWEGISLVRKKVLKSVVLVPQVVPGMCSQADRIAADAVTVAEELRGARAQRARGARISKRAIAAALKRSCGLTYHRVNEAWDMAQQILQEEGENEEE